MTLHYSPSLVLAISLCPAFATAEIADTQDPSIEQLRRQIMEIRREYERQQRKTEREIEVLRAEIDRLTTPSPPGSANASASNSPKVSDEPGSRDLPVTFNGDFRVRYENTSGIDTAPDRNRGVIRARLGASYRTSDSLTLGARLTTGDSDDLKTADETIGSFVDDLEISFDRAYLAYHNDNIFATAGKFSNPLVTTELVWLAD